MTAFGDRVRKNMDSDLVEPDKGPYKVRIDEASAFESKAGDEYAKLILEITEGPRAGERFQHFMGFKNPGVAEMNGNALAAYGVDWTNVNEVTDLDDEMGKLIGRTADVSVAYKDGYMNVNVHGSRNKAGEGNGDIPNDFTSPNATHQQAPAADFATAAGTAGDDSDLPF